MLNINHFADGVINVCCAWLCQNFYCTSSKTIEQDVLHWTRFYCELGSCHFSFFTKIPLKKTTKYVLIDVSLRKKSKLLSLGCVT